MKKSYKEKTAFIVISLYCLAGVIGLYTLVTVYNSYIYISQLVSQRGLVIGEQLLSVITYYMNSSISYLFYAITIWGLGYIISEISCFNKYKENSYNNLSEDHIDVNMNAEEEDLDLFVNEIRSDIK